MNGKQMLVAALSATLSIDALVLGEGQVAAIGPRTITYQGLVEDAGGPIDNQPMTVEFRAFNALAGGTQRGLTITKNLLASEMRQGVFSTDFDADELGLPDDGDETYLEVRVCSPSPCAPVALAPRTRVTHAALAASARALGGAASAEISGAMRVAGTGPEAGVMKVQKDLGGGVVQEMKIDASAGEVAMSRDDGAAAKAFMRSRSNTARTELELDDSEAMMRLTRINESAATAAISSKGFRFNAETGEVAAVRDTESAALRAASRSPNGDETYMLLDDGAAQISLGRQVLAANTAGISPPPRFAFSFGAGTAAMSAAPEPGDPNAAVMKLSSQSPSGEYTQLLLDDATGQFTFSKEALANTAALSRKFVVDAAAGSIAAFDGGGATALRLKTGDATAMEFSPGGEAKVLSPQGMRVGTFKIGGAAAANVAAGWACNTVPDPDVCAGGPFDGDECNSDDDCNSSAGLSVSKEGDVQLEVNGDVVDRWTGTGNTGFGVAPNRLSGSSYNYIEPNYYGCGVLSGGGPPSETFPTWDQDNEHPANDVCDRDTLGEPCVDNWNYCTYHYCTIAGGLQNHAGLFGFVGGGDSNFATGNHAVIAGGAGNRCGGNQASIAGGNSNRADGQMTAVAGGIGNTASGGAHFSAIPGGYYNIVGSIAGFAGGTRAVSRGGDHGSFVWADAQGVPADPIANPPTTNTFYSTAPNQFVVRALGGFWLGKQIYSTHTERREDAYFATDTYLQTTAGVSEACISGCTDGDPSPYPDAVACQQACYAAGARLTNGGTWTNASDRHSKENITPVEPREVLEKVSNMEIARWNYKVESDSTHHIGPMAQDFHAAFGLGDSVKSIATIDADGVALAAIQGLHQIVEEKDCRIAELEEHNHQLEGRLLAIEQQLKIAPR